MKALNRPQYKHPFFLWKYYELFQKCWHHGILTEVTAFELYLLSLPISFHNLLSKVEFSLKLYFRFELFMNGYWVLK